MKLFKLQKPLLLTAIVFTAGSLMAIPPPQAPDASSTSLLLVGVVAGMGLVKRFIRR